MENLKLLSKVEFSFQNINNFNQQIQDIFRRYRRSYRREWTPEELEILKRYQE